MRKANVNHHHPSNIILIGMPGSGKSTVGVIIAKQLGMNFLDSDIVIQNRQGRTLQEIVDNDGHLALRAIEEEVLLSIDVAAHVVATGGSAAYSDLAMQHLKRDGVVVFLDAALATLRKRIDNYETRGLAKRPEQSFADLFAERSTLYRKYADHIIDCNHGSQERIGERIVRRLSMT